MPLALLLLAVDFLSGLWPVLERAQCRICHNDNGVGSTTRLQFPPDGAGEEQVRGFGMRLGLLVDRSRPEESLLLLKPTNRTAHAGGERIKPGSAEEKLLREWVQFLITQRPPGGLSTRMGDESAPRAALRRLTHSQYNNTVRDLLGDDSRPASRFPKEDFVHGFTNQAESQTMSPLFAEAYARAAERLARVAFLGREITGSEAVKFVRDFGRRAFRRPLDAGELARYEKLLREAGLRTVVETMLQSPHFLFHLEPGAWGTASRLSYFLWDTMPDEELFRAAESGALDTLRGVETQARRMLDDPRARQSLRVFLREWLRFDRLESALRDRRVFPEFTAELVADMEEETQRLFGGLVWDDGDFREFFTARYTHVSPALGKLYGVPVLSGWTRVNLPSGRAGVLGHASFLTLTSKPVDTSPTERGLFVREHFLCQQVPPPPAGVNTTLPPVTDEKPLHGRQRLDIHLSNAACAGCHQLVDPIGFGLERFDAIGRWRDKEVITIYPTADELKTRRKVKPTEYKLDIDARGAVRGIKDSDFTSPAELGAVLAREPGCHRCVVKQLLRYGTGRMEEPPDQPSIDKALARFRDSQFRFRQLIIAIVTSEAFLGGTYANGRAQP